MKLSNIYIYPIKSLRPVECDSAVLTQHGVAYDRHFMMLKAVANSDKSGEKPSEHSLPGWKNMAITENNQMVRFFQSLRFPSSPDARDGVLTVTYRPVDGSEADAQTLDIPLTPDTDTLERIEITMHKSPTRAYRMPDAINAWFSQCFGLETMLVYLGDHRRPVLSSTTTHPAIKVAKGETAPLEADPTSSSTTTSWFSSTTSLASNLLSKVTTINPARPQITFADCAPFLVVSAKSLDDVSSRLPADETFDMTKFRPNFVVEGADHVWEEDFWAELSVTRNVELVNESRAAEKIVLHCLHNCVRCVSINIDYDTGAQGLGESGKMLKFLSRDRRVDAGVKYSPVFGRYTFLDAACEGSTVRVGDVVEVTKRNADRTVTGEFISQRFGWILFESGH